MTINRTAKTRRRWRQEMLIAQDNKCHWCKRDMTELSGYAHSATFDHLIPRSRGGKCGRYNLVLACKRCNCNRGNMMPRSIEISETVTA